MSLMKTKVEGNRVLKFLQDDFDKKVSSIDSLSDGELSQAFSFTSNNNNFIIRVNNSDSSFLKDKYAYENFASEKIPVPKILKIGKLGDSLYFCISERAEGQILDQIDEKDKEKLYPQLVIILDAIHSVKLSPGKYGWWEGDGIAEFDTWRSYVLWSRKETWEDLFKTTFLEKEFIEGMYVKMEKLSDKLPEERFLINGDFGGNNALSDGQKITGIIDWGNSAFGDFLYDVAYQEFWVGGSKIANIYHDHYKKIGWNTRYYDERINCYLLHIGIGVLEFWARAGLEEKYKVSKKRILEYL